MHCQGVGVIPLLDGGGGGGITFPRIFYPPPIIMHCQGVGVVPLLGGGG